MTHNCRLNPNAGLHAIDLHHAFATYSTRDADAVVLFHMDCIAIVHTSESDVTTKVMCVVCLPKSRDAS